MIIELNVTEETRAYCFRLLNSEIGNDHVMKGDN